MQSIYKSPIGVDTRIIREINLSKVFHTVRREKNKTISEISRITELTPATVKGVLDELVSYGLVKQTGIKNSTGGRKPGVYGLDLEKNIICGVNLHTHICETALMTLDGTIISIIRKDVYKQAPEDVAVKIQESFFSLCSDLNRSPESIIGMGVCQPGILGNDGDTIRFDVRHGWTEVPMGDLLRNLVPVPVFLTEEANAKLSAEIEFGEEEETSSLLYVLIGGPNESGVSGAIVINGEMITGLNGFAGEIGHTVIDPEGPACYCGRKGCWESVTDLFCFLEKFQHEGACPEFSDVCEFLNYLKTQNIDEVQENLLNDYIDIHAQGITNLIHIFNPGKIIIGGKITILGNLFLTRMQQSVSKFTMKPFNEDLEINLSRIEEKSALLGAVSIVLRHIVDLCQQKAGNR